MWRGRSQGSVTLQGRPASVMRCDPEAPEVWCPGIGEAAPASCLWERSRAGGSRRLGTWQPAFHLFTVALAAPAFSKRAHDSLTASPSQSRFRCLRGAAVFVATAIRSINMRDALRGGPEKLLTLSSMHSFRTSRFTVTAVTPIFTIPIIAKPVTEPVLDPTFQMILPSDSGRSKDGSSSPKSNTRVSFTES